MSAEPFTPWEAARVLFLLAMYAGAGYLAISFATHMIRTRHRRRRSRQALPPPDPRCIQNQDWKAHAPKFRS